MAGFQVTLRGRIWMTAEAAGAGERRRIRLDWGAAAAGAGGC